MDRAAGFADAAAAVFDVGVDVGLAAIRGVVVAIAEVARALDGAEAVQAARVAVGGVADDSAAVAVLCAVLQVHFTAGQRVAVAIAIPGGARDGAGSAVAARRAVGGGAVWSSNSRSGLPLYRGWPRSRPPTLLLQLPAPGLQVMPHWPPEQVAVPPAVLHAFEQVPQCSGSICSDVSQPFAPLLSQLPSPVLHWMVQTLLLQVGVPVDESHCLPHAPQLSMSPVVGNSQPLLESPSQLPQPLLQEMAHWPVLQEGEPCVLLQTLPHTPQWLMSLRVLTSQPLAGALSQSW